MAGRREAAMRTAPEKLPARQQIAVVHALIRHPGSGRVGVQRRMAHQVRAAGAGIGRNGVRCIHANTLRARMKTAKREALQEDMKKAARVGLRPGGWC